MQAAVQKAFGNRVPKLRSESGFEISPPPARTAAFYPDNPKAYQISQFDEPIGYNGWIEVQLEDGTTKKIGIERAHLEEDAGKNTHGTDGFSYVDLNRQGSH